MGEQTLITWTNHTFNPWIGCTKISAGCTHCYAETLMDTRMGRVQWGPQGLRVRTSSDNWKQPLRWNRKAAQDGVRRKVFCASLADVFEDHASISDVWRADLFNLIDQCPALDWLLLTKRPENIRPMVPGVWIDKGFPANVWIGTTAEDQPAADRRVPVLLSLPARVRFLSCEPLIGPIDLKGWIYTNGLWVDGDNRVDWVIAGGESGHGARAMDPDWARGLRDQCAAAAVPFFFKQWGSAGGDPTQHHGGDVLDGRRWQAFPNRV